MENLWTKKFESKECTAIKFEVKWRKHQTGLGNVSLMGKKRPTLWCDRGTTLGNTNVQNSLCKI